jgi:hypothetical protein
MLNLNMNKTIIAVAAGKVALIVLLELCNVY